MFEMSSPLSLELVAALCIGLSGAPERVSRRLYAAGPGIATALNVLGSVIGFVGLVLHARAGGTESLLLGRLPVGQLAFGLDGLSALFLIPILLVSALGSVYGTSYWSDREHPGSGRRLRLGWGIMTAAMMGVVLARDAIAFLVAWELMALAAFFLICTEEENPEVRQASWIYLVATHTGTLCLIGFFALLGHSTGSSALWPNLLPGDADGGPATAVFVLGIVGFGIKAGLMPLHVWLPGAHANAPSHVSALLSGVLLKAGIYGVMRVCGLVPEPPLWWGGVLLGIGAVSGVLGIALAVAQQDLKRLLAYSSIENIGIITIGVGLASVGRSLGRADLVALGLGGALFHVLNHSLFKPLLFFCAGSVLHATGTRRIAALGGLARTMPRTFALFALGAVAICGLPPLNGFAGELFLYVGLLRTASVDAARGSAWASVAAPALAMIGALAVAGFVKVVGIAFSGAPRSPAAAHAHDPGPRMLAPMVALSLACLALGLAPGVAVPLLRNAISAWDPVLGDAGLALSELVPLGYVSVAALLLIAGVAFGAVYVQRRSRARATGVTWDCGYAQPTARMQYVDSSFSETLVDLFHWAVQSHQQRPDLRGPFPLVSRFRSDIPDVVLDRIVQPLLGVADRGLARVRVLQRGPIQVYLLYVFLIVVALLMVTP